MSQEKVDRYKENKKNRKKTMKKEKRQHILACSAGIIVCAVIVGWAGWSVWKKYDENRPVSYTEINMDSISEYYSSMEE